MSPVDRDELLELAQLEMLGALDEQDVARLTRLRRAAPPLLQREVMDLQAVLAMDDSLLPDTDPDSALRSKVLAGVADAIDARRKDGVAPLASLGERTIVEPVVRSRSTRADEDEAVAVAVMQAAKDSNVDALVVKWRASAFFWRAASVALGASLLVLLLANHSLAGKVSHISELALGAATRQDLSAVTGPALAQHLQADAIVRGMVAPAGLNAAGVVLKSPLTQSGLLVAMNLSPRTTYDVVLRSGSDSWTIRSAFQSADTIDSIALNFGDAAIGPGSRVELVDHETGTVVLSATI